MRLLTFLLDIFFAPLCIHCRKEGEWLCETCMRLQPAFLYEYSSDIRFIAYLDEQWIRAAVHLLKYGGVPHIFRPFLGRAVQELRAWLRETGPPLWVPVPVSKKRLKERGYNQAAMLAQDLVEFCGGNVSNLALGKYERKSLVGAGKAERAHQAEEQFFWRNNQLPDSECYIVVDDVLTTGSTLRTCMKLVREHTDRPVYGLAVAHER
jgi:predicted amidophosphoribosyltransferase